MLLARSSSILAASSPDYWEQDHYTVNRIIDSASVFDCNSGNTLPIDWAGATDSPAFPLSSAQQGIWFAQQIAPSSPAYNIGEYIEIHGAIDPPLFEQALRQVVAETDALRVRIVARAGEPRQVVDASPTWAMPFVDLSAETDARTVAEASMKADLARPIDPTRGPLFAFALFKAAADRFYWYARYHHVAMDGFAMGVVARRMAEVYTALCAGRSAAEGVCGPLAVLLEQDAAYRASGQLAQDRQFWRDELAGRPDPGFGGHASGASDGFLRATGCVPDLDTRRAALARSPHGYAPAAGRKRSDSDFPASSHGRQGRGARAAGLGPRRRRQNHCRHDVERTAAAPVGRFRP